MTVPMPRARGGDDEHRRGQILDRDTDRLVERDLVGRRAPRLRARDELTELRVHVRRIRSRRRGSARAARWLRPEPARAPTRDSTTTSASSTVCASTSRPAVLNPTEFTCAPTLSHSRRTTGSGEWVVAHTMSAPASASANVCDRDHPSVELGREWRASRFGRLPWSRPAIRISRSARADARHRERVGAGLHARAEDRHHLGIGARRDGASRRPMRPRCAPR